MNKLTAEKCREQIDECRALKERGYLSINGEYKLQALELALPVLEQQESDGWIEWGGGSRPVPLWERLEVRLRSGNFRSGQTAAYWMWQHTGGINDIIAYRVVKHQEGE